MTNKLCGLTILAAVVVALSSFKKEAKVFSKIDDPMPLMAGRATTDTVYCYVSKHFKFVTNPCDDKLIRACTIADSILSLQAFWDTVRFNSKQKIDNSQYTMHRLADTLQNYKGVTMLELHKNNDEGRTTAGTNRANLTRLYSGAYNESVNDLAVTIIHEWVHSVDFAVNGEPLQFAHHRRQTRRRNINTASYRIETIADTFVK